jgi:hypothetical protein
VILLKRCFRILTTATFVILTALTPLVLKAWALSDADYKNFFGYDYGNAPDTLKVERPLPSAPDKPVSVAGEESSGKYAVSLAHAKLAGEYLKNKDWAKLAGIVHPEDGVIFSPYAYVEDEAVRLTRNEIASLGKDETIYAWGSYDGSGEPIELSFSDYYAEFVYDKDFLNAEMSVDKYIRTGLTANNIEKVFGVESSFAEFHVLGDENPEFTWTSLRLIFKRHEGESYLVGVVHDGWTI